MYQHARSELNDKIINHHLKLDIQRFENKYTEINTANDKQEVQITLSQKYVYEFDKRLEILLKNCQINLLLTWSD